MKYAWIREHRDLFPVAVLCEVLEVSASGYYDWLDRPPSPRAERHAKIQAVVQQVHAESHGVYVGMSRYAPLQRFEQHKAGIRAAGSVLKRGQELLIGPVLHLQRIAQADAVRIERDLAIALADAGLLVAGGH